MTKAPSEHFRLRSLTAHDGELLIGGSCVSLLVERAGQTPLFAYGRTAISERLTELRRALPESVQIHYAIKANLMPAVVGHIRPLVNGFDVASMKELSVALDAGMRADEISFAGPAKRPAELRAAIATGICINCESEIELGRIRDLSRDLGVIARVAVRVNPDFELKGAGMKMSGSPKQFGIDAERAPAIIRAVTDFGLSFEGLQIFCGSQNLNTDAIIEAHRKTLRLAVELIAGSAQPLKTLNIGGGYGIPYFPGETPIAPATIGAALEETLSTMSDALDETAIIVELGRYIVGEAGYYICRIVDIKESQGQLFAMVDGGLHHHLANSGNFGQVLRKNYPVIIANKIGIEPSKVISIVGPLCTPLDIVADRVAQPEPEIGDLVAVFQSGAYAHTASPQTFLSHPPAVEILV